MNRRPKLRIVAPNASAEVAAAVVAARERFMRETGMAPGPPPAPAVSPAGRVGANPWQRAALFEGVTRAPEVPPPWE
jgi:hypothetical protein